MTLLLLCVQPLLPSLPGPDAFVMGAGCGQLGTDAYMRTNEEGFGTCSTHFRPFSWRFGHMLPFLVRKHRLCLQDQQQLLGRVTHGYPQGILG
jgi:hypothetical protein